jgi:AraC-like DNA-binding protein
MKRLVPADFPRKTQVLTDHPHWLPGAYSGWDLYFLSWGVRRFGRQPVPRARHEGWTYIVLTEGAPTALLNGRGRKFPAPRVVIFHPDCVYGWTDRDAAACQVLCWEWATPPAHATLCPPPGGLRTFALDRAATRALGQLHAECVGAVTEPDDVAALILRRARLELDIRLLRATGQSHKVNAAARFDLAQRFLLRHPAALDPSAKLCEYLQVSPTTLKALFRCKTGMSPRAFALNDRMKRARARLTQGALVKEVAYELGYRHANDFSRAFASFHRKSVRAWLSAI